MAKRKTIQELKKSQDVYFRKRAKQNLLIPTTDINSELRIRVKNIKGSKGKVKEQKQKIKAYEKQNNRIKNQIRKLKEEQVKKKTSKKRKAEIELELKKPEYRTKSLSIERNYLKALEGKNFDLLVNDGFKDRKINTKKLKQIWKKGEDSALILLKGLKEETQKLILQYDKMLKSEKQTASKSRLKKLRKVKAALEDKLKFTIEKNIKAIESGNPKYLDQINDKGDKAYSLLWRIVGFNLDRVGI